MRHHEQSRIKACALSLIEQRERDPQRVWERGMGIGLEQREESSVICLEGAIDIGSAAELKRVLLEALAPGNAVSVSLDPGADLDVTAIQLLWAAEREARALGVGFKLAGQVPEPVSATLKDAGFESFPIPA
jgi:anti-anti-sigma regulatory factor